MARAAEGCAESSGHAWKHGFAGRTAAATISTSTIRDNWYTPTTFVACGLLVFSANGVNDANNVYLNNEKDKCGGGRGGTFEGSS